MNRLAYILSAAFLLAGAPRLGAQQIDPTLPPPPPPSPEAAVVPATPPEPVFDPYHAAKSIEIGTFYLRKGDYDAAIDRFAEAAHYQPKLAKPWKLMGEAYEKKGKKKPAVKAYQRYLDLYPHAEDAEKIRKKIERLHQEIDKEKKQMP